MALRPGWLALSPNWLALRSAWLDLRTARLALGLLGREGGLTNGQTPFYRTSSSIRAAALLQPNYNRRIV